jgi:predicted nuclease of predicted toxin-antitoxin system
LRLKLDENLPPGLADVCREAGHDASTVLDESLSGHPDEDVFAAARDEERALVTLDLDFSNPLRFPTANMAGVVVLRVRRPVVRAIEQTLRSVLPRLSADALKGKLWIVEPGRIRQHDPGESG